MWQLSIILITMFLLNAKIVCAAENIVPVMVRIDSGWITKPLEVKFTVRNLEEYVINMDFFITEPNSISHFFDKESSAESTRLWKILGGEVIDGRVKQAGFPGDIHLEVKNNDGKTVREWTVVRPITGASYMGRYGYLMRLNNLEPSIYTVTVSCLACSSELSSLKYHLGIIVPYHGK